MLAAITDKGALKVYEETMPPKFILKRSMKDIQDFSTSKNHLALLKKDGRLLLYSYSGKKWKNIAGSYKGASYVDIGDKHFLITYDNGSPKIVRMPKSIADVASELVIIDRTEQKY